MSGRGRRALLAGAVALPLTLSLTLSAARAAAQGNRMRRMRVSIPVDRLAEFLPVFRGFAASQPDLLFETLVRDDDKGLIASEILAAIRAGRPHADAALTDAGGVAWGATRGAWRSLPASLREAGEASASRLARLMRPLMGEEAMLVSADPGGPFLLHRPSVLSDPPRSAAALLDYARRNPGRFLYPRPSESALGQQFLMALPYLLGDRDPSDVQTGWTESWALLEELDRHIDYYPSDDAAAFDEFATGGIDLLPTSLTAFLRGRMDGLLPEDTGFVAFEDGRIIPQGVFLVVPHYAPDERFAVVEPFARFLLRPEIQSRAFGRGLLPGEPGFGVNRAAPLTDAERSAWSRALPSEEAERVAAVSLAPPLGPYQLAFMLHRWDEQIGARHGERR